MHAVPSEFIASESGVMDSTMLVYFEVPLVNAEQLVVLKTWKQGQTYRRL
jgi:hypothetical protein